MKRHLGSALLVLCAGLAVPAPALAQPTRADEIRAIREEMRNLATRLDALERAEAQADIGSPAPPPQPPPLPQPDPAFAANLNHALGIRERDGAAPHDGGAAIPSPIDRLLQPDGIGFQLSTSTEGTTVAMRAGTSVSSGSGNTGRYTTFAFTASAPLAKTGRFSDLGTLDGFVNSSTLRLQIGRYERRFVDAYDHPQYNALFEELKARCRRRLGLANETCRPGLLESGFVDEYGPELVTAYLAMARATGDPLRPVDWSARAYGVEFSIGYRNFEFVLPAPARTADADRIPLGARAYFSWLPDVRRNSLTWALDYQRTYKDVTAGALCPVIPASPELTCLTGPVGRPVPTERLVGSFEYRHRLVFPDGAFIPGLGLSAQVSYDVLNDDFGVDLPIYLVAGGDGQLTGGIRFGYTTDKDNFIVGLFVGTAFSLRP